MWNSPGRALTFGLLLAVTGAQASSPRITTQSLADAGFGTPASVDPSVAIGRGLGSMITCGVCAVGAAGIAMGGPGAILVAINTPGSAPALLGCVAACYESFK